MVVLCLGDAQDCVPHGVIVAGVSVRGVVEPWFRLPGVRWAPGVGAGPTGGSAPRPPGLCPPHHPTRSVER
ncbi:hypothetical protein SNL152K_5311 [Streptomyces sp. NL15-2K]|nr:hypothetical protein SNL152K_5311 [Streptomyces sp. NL15-2K]